MAIMISPHFSKEEFTCRDGTYEPISKKLLIILEQARHMAHDKPIHINSGYRSPRYNATLKGAAKHSYHMKGMAADITIEGLTVDEIADIFERLLIGTGGIGRYYEGHGNFVHVDVREVRSRWIMGKRPAKDGKPIADKPTEPKAYLFGNEVECIIKDDVSYISSRDIARILKLGVEWNGNTKTVKLERGN